jgi:hypothetical protein
MNLTKALNNVFDKLSHKERDILIRRLGLDGKEETLDDIAQDYNLSRERIRQIQDLALQKIKPFFQSSYEINSLIEKSKKRLQPLGVRREKTFLKLVAQDFNFTYQEIKIFKFMTILHPQIFFYPADNDFYDFYASEEDVLKTYKAIFTKIYSFFLKNQKLFLEQEIINLILKEIKKYFTVEPSYDDLLDCLKILKNIAKNPVNFWGLKNHFLITPRCLKHKIILIFKLEKKPLHFREIYQKLDELSKVEDEVIHYFWHRNYNINSIKNELIRHKDFIAIKKGFYYLKDPSKF